MSNFILQQTAINFQNNSNLIDSKQVVETLLQCEKESKQNKTSYQLSDLIGTWRLCFITGTKKTREKAGVMLGSGRYIPQFTKIYITYTTENTVENQVIFLGVKLTVSGLIKFLGKQNILIFDFTRMKLEVLGLKLYEGYIRGGLEKEKNFEEESIKNQAFFAYFLVEDGIIAARGKGGGLALWSKEK